MRENRRTLVGTVVGNKMEKTVLVEVEMRKAHRLYRRIIKSTKRYKAHDEEKACAMGDIVRLVESRPISKEKHWRVVEIVTRRQVADIAPSEIGAPALEEAEEAPAT